MKLLVFFVCLSVPVWLGQSVSLVGFKLVIFTIFDLHVDALLVDDSVIVTLLVRSGATGPISLVTLFKMLFCYRFCFCFFFFLVKNKNFQNSFGCSGVSVKDGFLSL